VKRLAAALLFCGCGHSLLPELVDGSASDAADDATDAGDPFSPDAMPIEAFHCPAGAPTEGAACSAGFGPCAQSEPCEYGGAARPECNDLFYCTKGTWERAGPTSVCTGDAGSPCPVSAIGDAGACTGNGSCSPPDGNCACTGGRWDCIAASPSCPPSRPPGGSECADASPSLRCYYPELFACHWLECGGCGFWTESTVLCQ
jgi:hypothetical protein